MLLLQNIRIIAKYIAREEHCSVYTPTDIKNFKEYFGQTLSFRKICGVTSVSHLESIQALQLFLFIYILWNILIIKISFNFV